MKMEVLEAQFYENRVLRDRLLRFVRYFLAQVTQTAACNRVHHLEMRMRRWLLMVHDRTKRDSFPITHEYMANMLGTGRSEVTVAIGKLRDDGLIKSARGQIMILDRERLEESACECYQIVDTELNVPR